MLHRGIVRKTTSDAIAAYALGQFVISWMPPRIRIATTRDAWSLPRVVPPVTRYAPWLTPVASTLG